MTGPMVITIPDYAVKLMEDRCRSHELTALAAQWCVADTEKRLAKSEAKSRKLEADKDTDWWTDAQIAAWRGESLSTFRRKLPELEAAGFPLKRGRKRYVPAIKAWAMEGDEANETHEEQASAAIERHRLTLVR